MKELLISFLACLVIGAVINGMNIPVPPASTPPTADTQPAVDGQQTGDAAAGTAAGAAAGTTGTSVDGTTASSISMKAAAETGDASFDQDVLKSQVPVLVDFGASWCAPCQAMAPIVDNLAQDYSGKVKVFTVDTDRNPNIRDKFHVTALPTFMMFQGGRPVSPQYSGQMAKEMLAGVIDHQLGLQ